MHWALATVQDEIIRALEVDKDFPPEFTFYIPDEAFKDLVKNAKAVGGKSLPETAKRLVTKMQGYIVYLCPDSYKDPGKWH